jgi:hypothetical protein
MVMQPTCTLKPMQAPCAVRTEARPPTGERALWQCKVSGRAAPTHHLHSAVIKWE